MIRKLNKNLIIFSLLILQLLCFSCKALTDSFNTPIKEYFKQYTENAIIADMSTEAPFLSDKNKLKCYSSKEDLTFISNIINTQNYILELDCTFDYIELVKDQDYIIYQDSENINLLHFILKKEFLNTIDGNSSKNNLKGTITLKETFSKRQFSPFPFEFKINSAPPQIIEKMICLSDSKDNPNTQYILFFFIPDFKNTIHESDTHTIYIDNKKYTFSQNEGILSITDDKDGNFIARPETLTPINDNYALFPETLQGYYPLYYKTNRTITTEELIFELKLQDDDGFYSTSIISNQDRKLTPPLIDGISKEQQPKTVKPKAETVYYELQIQHDGLCTDGKAETGVTINYTITEKNGNKVFENGTANILTGTAQDIANIKLLPGEYLIKAENTKANIIRSESSTLNLTVEKRKLKGSLLYNTLNEEVGPYDYNMIDEYTGVYNLILKSQNECLDNDKVSDVKIDYTITEKNNRLVFENNTLSTFTSSATDIANISLLPGVYTIKAVSSKEHYINSDEKTFDVTIKSPASVYVSNSGSDTNNGTKAYPFASIQKAIERVSESTFRTENDLSEWDSVNIVLLTDIEQSGEISIDTAITGMITIQGILTESENSSNAQNLKKIIQTKGSYLSFNIKNDSSYETWFNNICFEGLSNSTDTNAPQNIINLSSGSLGFDGCKFTDCVISKGALINSASSVQIKNTIIENCRSINNSVYIIKDNSLMINNVTAKNNGNQNSTNVEYLFYADSINAENCDIQNNNAQVFASQKFNSTEIIVKVTLDKKNIIKNNFRNIYISENQTDPCIIINQNGIEGSEIVIDSAIKPEYNSSFDTISKVTFASDAYNTTDYSSCFTFNYVGGTNIEEYPIETVASYDGGVKYQAYATKTAVSFDPYKTLKVGSVKVTSENGQNNLILSNITLDNVDIVAGTKVSIKIFNGSEDVTSVYLSNTSQNISISGSANFTLIKELNVSFGNYFVYVTVEITNEETGEVRQYGESFTVE